MVRRGSPEAHNALLDQHWHAMPPEKVIEELGTHVHGLTRQEAALRFKRLGPNILPSPPMPGAWAILLRQLKSLFTVVLGVAAAISFVLGDTLEGGVIFAIVALNVVLSFAQEYKAENAIEALRKILKYEATVVRDGEPDRTEGSNVVPGDIILLASGERVPADARLIEIKNFEVNEAVLTGEAFPVAKQIEIVPEGVAIAERRSMVYSGTYVTRGEAIAIAVSTGALTEVGQIALLIRTAPEEETPLEERLGDLARYITIGVGALAVLMFLFGLATLHTIPFRERFVTMFTTSVAVAVAAIPEGLIAAITLILTTGMVRLLGRKALVRRLRAAETLGATTVICVDKTGTVTEGRMRVAEITGAETGDIVASEATLKAAVFANEAWVEEPPNGKGIHEAFRLVGDPTDTAILEAGFSSGLHEIIDQREKLCIDRLPFESENQFVAALTHEGGENHIYLKGSGEKLIPACTKVFIHGEAREISPHERGGLTRRHNEFSSKGLRVLAVARANVEPETKKLPEAKSMLASLTFLGFVVLEDPLRHGVREALEEARQAGIKVILITGDHVLTARKIAHDLGIVQNHESPVIEGSQLLELSEEELLKRIGSVAVFARTHPRDKLRIVEALKKRGEVVAMTGDGINDAPAIKAAHIGIGLGSGTDVAKEAADMVILDDNFSTIVAAVREGRVIFDNIRKVVLFLMIDALTEVMLVFASILFGLPLPVLAAQILFVNLVEDGLPALSLAFEPAERDVMQGPPRSKDEPIFSKQMLIQVLGIGTFVNILFVATFAWLINGFHVPLAEAQTIMFAALGFDSFIAIFAIRSLRTPIWKINPLRNPQLMGAVIVGLGALGAAVYLPLFQKFLGTVSLGLERWVLIGALAFIGLAGIEAVKFLTQKFLRSSVLQ